MDYYSILGLKRGASEGDIRKAYKKMSMKHHPDRGGNESQFKKVNEAYQTLSDPQKKQIYDMGGNPNQQGHAGGYNRGPFEFRFDTGNFDDIFGGFGFRRQQQQRNRNVNITVSIQLEDVYFGKTIHAEVSMPGKKTKLVTIEIPKGIEDNQSIRYQGMGDDTIPNIPLGDLIVNVRLLSHNIFARQGDNLYIDYLISAWDCMLGTQISIQTIDKRTLNINIPAGTQPDTTLRVTGEGVPNVKTHTKGNLFVKVKTEIPRNLSKEQQDKIKELKNLG